MKPLVPPEAVTLVVPEGRRTARRLLSAMVVQIERYGCIVRLPSGLELEMCFAGGDVRTSGNGALGKGIPTALRNVRLHDNDLELFRAKVGWGHVG